MLAYIHAKGARSSYKPKGVHETGGLPGNMALDFFAKPGTKVVATQHGIISRLSGHDPVTGMHPGAVFGWSYYLSTVDGFYFVTHLGHRYCHEGQHVEPGTLLGTVGAWPAGVADSHTHCGFTAHGGRKASIARILAVGLAPHLTPLPPL